MTVDAAFEHSLRVRSGDANTIREVTSLRDACDILIDWPHARRGPFYQSAREVVEAAMEGHATVQEARTAFAALASHAGVLVE
ncbi:DUF982 domain-containing protein [Pseudaminobacter sp. NGMCC 1.201702]|uniref:DUF982 domain-containing protein n=1 Tax=Pseudaminobacter sp. NGMCC 1.201702 TaxID=3391825 RepID=UPI0039EE4D73